MSPGPVQILLIEDDADIARIISVNVGELNAQCVHCNDGQDGLDRALSENFDLLILDLMLPSLNGIEICKKVREVNKTVPILMITGKSEEIDKVIGLEVGADDYITKPFGIREMLARVKALLRRATVSMEQSGDLDSSVIDFGCFWLDPVMRRVKIDGSELELSAIEFELLLFLAQNPGRPFTREELARSVWESNASAFESTVTSQLSRLRKRIEKDPANPRFILTVRGVGYRFARPEELDG